LQNGICLCAASMETSFPIPAVVLPPGTAVGRRSSCGTRKCCCRRWLNRRRPNYRTGDSRHESAGACVQYSGVTYVDGDRFEIVEVCWEPVKLWGIDFTEFLIFLEACWGLVIEKFFKSAGDRLVYITKTEGIVYWRDCYAVEVPENIWLLKVYDEIFLRRTAGVCTIPVVGRRRLPGRRWAVLNGSRLLGPVGVEQ